MGQPSSFTRATTNLCLRHRRTQTLFVSDIINPSTCANPGYGKLHVGIYIAAIQDIIDRKQQQQQLLPQTKPSDGGDSASGDKKKEKTKIIIEDLEAVKTLNARRINVESWKGREGVADCKLWQERQVLPTPLRYVLYVGLKDVKSYDDPDGHQKAMHMASNCDVVFIYLQCHIFDSPVPASFLCSIPSITAKYLTANPPFCPRAIDTYGPEERLTVVLTSEIGQGATGTVLRGTLEPEILDFTMPLDMVVKLAFDFEQRDAHRGEYEVYRRLRLNGVHQGIATVLGFFYD